MGGRVQIKLNTYMKHLKSIFFLSAFVLFSGMLMAQTPKKGTLKADLKVPALCEECKGVIENAIWKRIDGVLYIEAFPRKKIVRVTIATERIDLDNLRLRIADLGFDVDNEKGLLEGYNKLPKECREKVPKPAALPEE
jgi:periplasmic mercuric ion binding protein